MAGSIKGNENTVSLRLESYTEQKKHHWPKEGRHILAQYDDEGVIVYQAFRPEIAEYAVKNQKLGGDKFSFDRMSWIKTNFLWMMYRCGWAKKEMQERVLAIKVKRDKFDEILKRAFTVRAQRAANLGTKDIKVRLQWDPDHSPRFGPLQRRAIQLGLKGETLREYANDWIISIEDITAFVQDQSVNISADAEDKLMTPSERVYLASSEILAHVEADTLQ